MGEINMNAIEIGKGALAGVVGLTGAEGALPHPTQADIQNALTQPKTAEVIHVGEYNPNAPLVVETPQGPQELRVAKATGTPFGKESAEAVQEAPFPTYAVSLGDVRDPANSKLALDIEKVKNPNSPEYKKLPTITNQQEFKDLMLIYNDITNYVAQTEGKPVGEFRIEPDFYRANDGQVKASAVITHKDKNGYTDTSYLYSVQATPDGKPIAVIATIPIPEPLRGKIWVGLGMPDGSRLVPAVKNDKGEIVNVIPDIQTDSDLQAVAAPTPTPDMSKKENVQQVSFTMDDKGGVKSAVERPEAPTSTDIITKMIAGSREMVVNRDPNDSVTLQISKRAQETGFNPDVEILDKGRLGAAKAWVYYQTLKENGSPLAAGSYDQFLAKVEAAQKKGQEITVPFIVRDKTTGEKITVNAHIGKLSHKGSYAGKNLEVTEEGGTPFEVTILSMDDFYNDFGTKLPLSYVSGGSDAQQRVGFFADKNNPDKIYMFVADNQSTLKIVKGRDAVNQALFLCNKLGSMIYLALPTDIQNKILDGEIKSITTLKEASLGKEPFMTPYRNLFVGDGKPFVPGKIPFFLRIVETTPSPARYTPAENPSDARAVFFPVPRSRRQTANQL